MRPNGAEDSRRSPFSRGPDGFAFWSLRGRGDDCRPLVVAAQRRARVRAGGWTRGGHDTFRPSSGRSGCDTHSRFTGRARPLPELRRGPGDSCRAGHSRTGTESLSRRPTVEPLLAWGRIRPPPIPRRKRPVRLCVVHAVRAGRGGRRVKASIPLGRQVRHAGAS